MAEFSVIETKNIESLFIYDLSPLLSSSSLSGQCLEKISLPLLGLRMKTNHETCSYYGTVLSMNKSALVFPYDLELTLDFAAILSSSEVDVISIRNYDNLLQRTRIVASISFIDLLLDGYTGIKAQISFVKIDPNVVKKGLRVLSATPSSALEAGDFIMSVNGISFNILSNEMIISVFHALKNRRVSVLKSGGSFLPYEGEESGEKTVKKVINREFAHSEYDCSQSQFQAQWKTSRSRYILTRIFHHTLPPTICDAHQDEGRGVGKEDILLPEQEHGVNVKYFAAMRYHYPCRYLCHRYHIILSTDHFSLSAAEVLGYHMITSAAIRDMRLRFARRGKSVS